MTHPTPAGTASPAADARPAGVTSRAPANSGGGGVTHTSPPPGLFGGTTRYRAVALPVRACRMCRDAFVPGQAAITACPRCGGYEAGALRRVG